jgi:hypothetical protein
VSSELSHQQSREIQQHHNEIHNTNLGININIEPQKIKQAVTETANKFASAAKDAAKSAQHYYKARNPSYSSSDHDGGAYMGPYAKLSRNQRNQHGAPMGTDGACADFGLRDSVFGEYDPFRAELDSDADHNSASSAPLLPNNYGMDAELGISMGTSMGMGSGTDSSSMNQNQNDRKFVLLERFRVKKEIGTVANLDLFFTSLYNYYYHRGIVPIVGKGIVELVSLFFTLWLSVFLLAYVDWQELRSCTDEESCKDFFSLYIKEKVRH